MKKEPLRLVCVFAIDVEDEIDFSTMAPDKAVEKLQALNLAEATVHYIAQNSRPECDASTPEELEKLKADITSQVDFEMLLKYAGSVSGQYVKFLSGAQGPRIVVPN